MITNIMNKHCDKTYTCYNLRIIKVQLQAQNIICVLKFKDTYKIAVAK